MFANNRNKKIKSKILWTIWLELKQHLQECTLQHILLQIVLVIGIILLIFSTFHALLFDTDDDEFIAFDSKISNNNTNLKLMSINLRNEILDKNDANQLKHWDLRRKAVKELLNDGQYDIIGTQEGLPSQIKDISDDIESYYDHYGLGRLPSTWYGSSKDDMNEHCAIFWRNDKLKLFDYGTFWLSNDPTKMGSKYYDSPLPRIATWILLDIKNNDKYQILFVNTHLGLSQKIRNKQIALISRFIQEIIHRNTKELLVFVVGDFNEAIKGSLWHKLFDEGSTDTVRNVLTDCIVDYQDINNKKLNANFTYHAFEGLNHAKNDKNQAPIDWMLCSKNILNQNDIQLKDVYIATESKKTVNGTMYPSDHFPVVLELNVS